MFYSYKFGKKLVYINRLAELDSVLYMDQLDIPKEVIELVYDENNLYMNMPSSVNENTTVQTLAAVVDSELIFCLLRA